MLLTASNEPKSSEQRCKANSFDHDAGLHHPVAEGELSRRSSSDSSFAMRRPARNSRSLATLHANIGNQAILRILHQQTRGLPGNGLPGRETDAKLNKAVFGSSFRNRAALHAPANVAAHFFPMPRSGAGTVAIQRYADPEPNIVGGNQDLVPPAETAASSLEAVPDNPDDQGEGVAAIEEGYPFGSGSPDEDAVQTYSEHAVATGSLLPPASYVRSHLDGGTPMAPPILRSMESFFGAKFGSVRIHADAPAATLAKSLSARAMTLGEHIAFDTARYQPNSASGRRLLVHELAHVVQQRRGLGEDILRDGIGHAGDSYEREAERTADLFTIQSPFPGGRSSARVRNGENPSALSGAAALQLFANATAGAYAKKWALSTNPAYGVLGDNDCTNFASQAMEAGGWTQLPGSNRCDERKNDNVWWFLRDGCTRMWPFPNIHASHTWGGAENFRRFLSVSGRGTPLKRVADLVEGDILQRGHGDAEAHHTMVVTNRGIAALGDGTIIDPQIFVSYHTNNTLERPFWGPGGFHETTLQGWEYWAWRIS